MVEKWKTAINPKNNDDKCFRYAIRGSLNFEQVEKELQRISKIKPFIDQYNWKQMSFSSLKNDWKKS